MNNQHSTMEYEDIFLSYNLDMLLNIYEKLKEQSLYSGIMDLDTKSTEFIDTIVDHVEYYDVPSEISNELYDESDYYNYES